MTKKMECAGGDLATSNELGYRPLLQESCSIGPIRLKIYLG